MHYLEKELNHLITVDSSIFQFIQSAALDGLWYWDLSKMDEEWMNATFWETLGYSPSTKEHSPSSWMDIINKDDLELAKENLEKHLKDPSYPYDQIVRYRNGVGTTTWIRCRGKAIFDKNGAPSRMLGAHTDITLLKEKEIILEHCNEAADIGYWEVNFADNTIDWSKMTKQIHEVPLDFQPDLETGINFYKEGYFRNLVTKKVNHAIESQQGFEIEAIIITGTGSEKWVKAIGIPEHVQDKCIRIYGTFQDIHEKKTYVSKIQSLYDKTVDQNKRLVNFSNIVSHNLKNHTGNIGLLTSILEDEFPQLRDNQIFSYLKEASNSLTTTIHHLVDMALPSEGTDIGYEVINVKLFVERAKNSVILQAKNKNSVDLDIDPDLHIRAIPAYFESICQNLISNALKYKSPNRMLKMKIFTEIKENNILLMFQDNGMGIDLKKHKKKLFQMYTTFHDNSDATGIGLYITKNQVESMEGEIMVESVLNEGTTFTLMFPLIDMDELTSNNASSIEF